MSYKPTLVRITTVPLSLDKLLEGQLKFMSQYYHVIAMSASDNGYLEQVASRENVEYHAIELTRSITPIKDIICLIQLIAYLKKVKPDIVHSHTPKAGITGMLAAKIAGVPVRLHTVAGLPLLETKGLKRKMLNMVEKITYKAATKVLPNSHGLKQIIINQKFIKEEKLHVIGFGSSNGIDVNYFDSTIYNQKEKLDLRKALGINPDDFVYIFVGRVVKDKGIEELVKAFSSLSLPQVKLLLIGNKEDKLDPLSQDILTEIESNNNIIDAGWKQDVRPYYAISDALTFPSYREGFPNVVLQALSMCLPAIASDINGCNEIIEHNHNGMLIPAKNHLALKQAMVKIATDHTFFQSLQKNTRNSILDKYKRECIFNELKEFYNQQIKQL